MRSEVGSRSQSEYKVATGERFEDITFTYTPEQALEAARQLGLELHGSIREMAVEDRVFTSGLISGVIFQERHIAQRARKWLGTSIWYGMLRRKL